MACGRVGKAWERSWAAVAVVVLVGVVVLAGSVDSFNRDRPIIKWSPLWLNNYRPRGVLFKRFRDEPIDKWTPGYFSSSPEHYYDQKKFNGFGNY
ncbi:uncharacterized protein LOC126985889 isoform X2 [Eriocheir sinensis]|uniref:uncharacterized protein LOC126985889 isoform X2 n=1 Tax=Eriocheir sinensis TaxID=95602 RepID=UPI0021CA2DBF|nr:uncharacterized protein LOC126985889 isoform X2 [Eriocheir sinensis]